MKVGVKVGKIVSLIVKFLFAFFSIISILQLWSKITGHSPTEIQLIIFFSGIVITIFVYLMRDLKGEILENRRDIKENRKEIQILKTDVSILKTDVGILKTDVSILKTDVKDIKGDIGNIKLILKTKL